MTRRVKIVFSAILIVLIIGMSSVFALTEREIQAVMEATVFPEELIESTRLETIAEEVSQFEYVVLYYNYPEMIIAGSNTKPLWISNNRILVNPNIMYVIHKNTKTITKTIYNFETTNDGYVYLENGSYDSNGVQVNPPGYENIEIISKLPPLITYPYFNFSNDLITNYITLDNGNVLNGFNYDITIENNHALGTITDINHYLSNIDRIRLNKWNLKGEKPKDYYRVLYEDNTLINGESWGYLELNEITSEYAEFLIYYPNNFIQPNYIYYLQVALKDGTFMDITPFIISEAKEPEVLTSGDVDNIIEDEDNMSNGDLAGTITGSINDLNNNINNTIENTILGEENESGDRQGGLLGGIIDGISGLFIPSEDYFSNYFTELNDWFSERLGLLYFPFELIFDFIDRVLSINFSEPRLEIGPYKFPQFDNVEIIPKLEFNFNDYLENETFKWVHDTYLIIVDALIVFGLVGLIRQKYEEVMTK